MPPSMASAGGGTPGGPFGDASQPSVATLNARLKQAKEKVPTKNQWFNQDLFGAYRDREIGGKKIKSRSVRDLTKYGKIPQLPLSKEDEK